jgi:Fic family protein
MIKIEKKNIKNKGFYYLSEQINAGKGFKKIQVYLGKDIPNDLTRFALSLKEKEINLVFENIKNLYLIKDNLYLVLCKEVEKTRIEFKYAFYLFSSFKKDIFWRDFAIKFIFESNSIEGSRLSRDEIENIIKNKYIKKSVNRKEILEVENSIEAFNKIQNNEFKLNQNNIKDLHKTIVDGLGVEFGYKKNKIVVNNKNTCLLEKTREEMTKLINWWFEKQKTKENKFFLAIKFHQKFEAIHPFSDGNGRVGRLILIWMLIKSNYIVILFKNKNRSKYFNSLNLADKDRNTKLYKYSANVYKETFKELFN